MPEIINPWSSSSSGNGDGDGTPTIQNPWTTPGLLTPITPTKDLTLNDFPTPSNANATNGAPSASGSADSGGNIFSNIWQNIVNGYDHAKGALQGGMEGAYGGFPQALVQSNGNPLKFLWNELQSTGQGIKNGFMNPDQQNQEFQQVKNAAFDQLPNHSGWLPKFVADTVTDPLSYVPLEKPISLAGKAIKAGSDLAGLTPYVQSAVDAIKSTKPVTAVTDALGKAFVKNYGASDALNGILNQGTGDYALHQYNNLRALKDLQTSHGLTPDQLNEIGHITEKTAQGTPEQQALAQNLSQLLEQGAPGSGIGSNLLSQTASSVSGEPLLNAKIDNYFPHIYNNIPDELKGVFPKQTDGVGGLSANGTYNLPRTFGTLQDAQNQGLKPELNPFLATGTRLDQMSKAYVNNNIIGKIKNTPGILFEKDPIDEVSKLVKTGRMTTDQAAAQLGMTVDDLKKGFVQSKIPQLRGAYIRPADEAALTDYLQPAKASGLFGSLNKLNNLYNQGFLINPLPHLHNVTTNGMLLGGAKPSYVSEALDGIKAGGDPWYMRAIKSNAVNNPVEGSFAKAITSQAPSNPLSAAKKASHDLLWNTDAAIRTALFRQGVEDGLSDTAAAARTNKFMVDYNNITPFERKYIKPVVSFYNWKKGNIPLQLSQTLAQTPKYVAYDHLKNAISQALSGGPDDQKGRIMTGETLPDGSKVALDPYSPMDEPGKIMDKGIVPWAIGSINPVWREIGAQLGLGSFPVRYNAQAPLDYNARIGVAHAINALNPVGGSAMLGEVGNVNNGVSNAVNWTADHLFGGNSVNDIQTKDKPGQTTSELITKLLGGFTGRDNPAKDARNAQYDARNKVQGTISYLKSTGQAVPKSLKKEAYRKITLPPGYQTGG